MNQITSNLGGKGWENRFNTAQYSENEGLAAIRGQGVPFHLGSWVTQLCVLRGIRYHHGFATELRNIPRHPQFSRALNARDIMSNVIPEMSLEEHFPYCIWHPDVAAEETYRALARRYPQMRYHVGRACAVAGYANLYQELDLLPDVTIAEEARDNSNSQDSRKIFDSIVQQSVRWRVMDDYTRTVNLASPEAILNGLSGDTAVRSTLELKRMLEEPGSLSRFQEDGTYRPLDEGEPAPPYFNITEDWNIDEYNSTLKGAPSTRRFVRHPAPNTSEMIRLLWNPLPRDLPGGNKDILILLAAYQGNIDRYVRLRRPGVTLTAEPNCIVRGIFHNPLFARWWAEQPLSQSQRYQADITARFIMSNDLSRVTPETPRSDLPTLIWYPSIAHAATYEELARRRPDMHTAVARACIAANYPHVWDKLELDWRRRALGGCKREQQSAVLGRLTKEGRGKWPGSARVR